MLVGIENNDTKKTIIFFQITILFILALGFLRLHQIGCSWYLQGLIFVINVSIFLFYFYVKLGRNFDTATSEKRQIGSRLSFEGVSRCSMGKLRIQDIVIPIL